MLQNKVLIAPSILSADFGRLNEEVINVIKAGADFLHLDVMDGHFVPNISFGFPILESISKISTVPIDCHLMISNPENYIERFAKKNASIITIHIEATNHAERLLSQIKSLGKLAGISFNPQTDVNCLEYLIHTIDLVLIMSVNPGFGGQSFIYSAIDKIKKVKEIAIKHKKENLYIQVDGGITNENKQLVIDAGVNIIVSGSYIFSSKDYKLAINSLR